MKVKLIGKQIREKLLLLIIINLITIQYFFSFAAAQETVEKRVVVAVIDTGIDYNSEELCDFRWTNEEEIPKDGLDNDKNGYIDDKNGWNFYGGNNRVYNSANTYDDHGTHCAGIIIANTNATNIKIMSLKVLGGAGSTGKISDVIRAIQYAEKMGADICNMSLGAELDNPKLKKVIKQSKMLFITAAGNNIMGADLDTKGIYPAVYQLSNLISVANCLEDGTLNPTSNYGRTTVTLASSGTNIYSTLTGGRAGILTGTSMAAARVTGIAASLYGTNVLLKASEAKNKIIQMVEKKDELENVLITSGILQTVREEK